MIKRFLIIIAILIIALNTILTGTSNASADKTLYSTGRCDTLLTYNGYDVGVVGVAYTLNGVEYPAFCLERHLPGVGEGAGEVDELDIQTADILTNHLIWRVVSNSYPYKSLKELGVNTVEEAFVATKQAVYCVIYGNDANNFSRYGAVGEAGKRTLDLLKTLVTDARNSKETRPSTYIGIIEDTRTWEVDNIDKNYFSKTYSIKTDAAYKNYNVSISGNKLLQDIQIVDIQNNITNTFGYGKQFKLLIPINHNIENGDFEIEVAAELETNPVYFGVAPTGYQDYALAAYKYELGETNFTENYDINRNQLIINKIDGNTNLGLAGVHFAILDENKNQVFSNLVSNTEGKVIVDKIIPGKYYLKEIRTVEGYSLYEELIEFEMELNQALEINIKNYPYDNTYIDVNTNEINVSSMERSVNVENTSLVNNISTEVEEINTVKKLPKTGM